MGSVRTPTDPWRTPIFYTKTRTPPQLIIPNYQVVVMLWNCCCNQLGIRHNNVKHGPLFSKRHQFVNDPVACKIILQGVQDQI